MMRRIQMFGLTVLTCLLGLVVLMSTLTYSQAQDTKQKETPDRKPDVIYVPTPQEVVDEYHKLNGEAFASAGIDFDIWGRTSSPEHHVLTQEVFKRLYAKGYIEKRNTQQLSAGSQP